MRKGERDNIIWIKLVTGCERKERRREKEREKQTDREREKKKTREGKKERRREGERKGGYIELVRG